MSEETPICMLLVTTVAFAVLWIWFMKIGDETLKKYNDLRLRLDAVGIKEIFRCEINTTDCQTNWYEIVWKEGARK